MQHNQQCTDHQKGGSNSVLALAMVTGFGGGSSQNSNGDAFAADDTRVSLIHSSAGYLLM